MQKPPVANAIKLLQACIYKSVKTGLFLTSLVATSVVKFMLLMNVSRSIWYLEVKTSINMWNYTILMVTDDVKNSPVLATGAFSKHRLGQARYGLGSGGFRRHCWRD